MAEREWHQQVSDWARFHYIDKVDGRFSDTTIQIANSIGKDNKDTVEVVKTATPLAAAAAVAGTGYFLLDHITKATDFAAKGVKQVVTGLGYFEKIPMIGGVFTTAGNVVEGASQYVAMAVPAVGGLLTYTLMRPSSIPVTAAEDDKTSFHLTGRKGRAPVMDNAEVTNPKTGLVIFDTGKTIPVAPAEKDPLTPATAEVAANLHLDGMLSSQMHALREKAIAEKDKALDKALEEYIGRYNQIYEDKRNWVTAAETFRSGPRKKLVDALVTLGMTDNEADRFVPTPPRLPPTIYSDGTDFPTGLVSFARDFQKIYGEGGPEIKTPDGTQVFTFIDHTGETPRRMPWEEMSVTQKEEFLKKAITFTETRHKFFENKKRTTSSDPDPYANVNTQSYDYGDTGGQIYLFSTPPTGSTYPNLDWKTEHTSLLSLVGCSEYKDFRGNTDLIAGESLKKHLENWRDQQKNSDEHKALLHAADGKIQHFGKQVAAMKTHLNLIKHTELQIIDTTPGPDNLTDLEIKDIRRYIPGVSTTSDTQKWLWRGTQNGEVFTIREIYDETGHQVTLSQPLAINLTSGQGSKELQAITDAHNQKSLTERAAAPLSYKTPDQRFIIGDIISNTNPHPQQLKVVSAENSKHFYTVTDKKTGMAFNIVGTSSGENFTMYAYQVKGKDGDAQSHQYHLTAPREFKRTDIANLTAIVNTAAAEENTRYRYELSAITTNALPPESAAPQSYNLTNLLSGNTFKIHGTQSGKQFIATGYEIASEHDKPEYKKFTHPRTLSLSDLEQQKAFMKHVLARENTNSRFIYSDITENKHTAAQLNTKLFSDAELKTLQVQTVQDNLTGLNVNFFGTYDKYTNLFSVKAYEVISSLGQPRKLEAFAPAQKIDTGKPHFYNNLFKIIAESRNLQYTKAPRPEMEAHPAFLALANGTPVAPLPTFSLPKHLNSQPYFG